MDYGKVFRVVRAAHHLQQAELSRLLNVRPSFISLIEGGKRNPSQETIKKLASSLDIPLSLIHLLASEPRDLNLHGEREVGLLAESLLRLIVEASSTQAKLPFDRE